MNEQEIILSLYNETSSKNHLWMLCNVYLFLWESDFISFTSKNLFCIEYEIKVSRSDFKADFKKPLRHDILKNGQVEGSKILRPNRFYYVVPEGLIEPHEVPKYTGLLYVRKTEVEPPNDELVSFIKIKNAPLLHNETLFLEFKEDIFKHLWFRYWDIKEKFFKSLDNKNQITYDEDKSQNLKG